MKKSALAVAIMAVIGGCASSGDPWLTTASGAAAVSAGAAAPILTLASDPVDCAPRPAPTVAIVQQPALGSIFVEPSERLIDPEGVVCPADAVQPISTVFYEAASPGPAIDTVVLRETSDAMLPDRDHTIEVRIR